MPDLTPEQRRENRKLVLQALQSETGSSGGDLAAPRVQAFVADPQAASTDDYVYVGALRLTRFYVDPSKPNASERRSLWQAVRTRMGRPTGNAPADIDGNTPVRTLQVLAEEQP